MPLIKKKTQYFYGSFAVENKYTNAQDAFGDTILVALISWDKYADINNFMTHVFGYLKYYKYLQQRYEQRYLADGNVFLERSIARYALSPIKTSETTENNILKVIGNLPAIDKEVLEMFVIDCWSKREIAQQLGMTETEVNERYRKALKLTRLNRLQIA